jgi:hypothetical protein
MEEKKEEKKDVNSLIKLGLWFSPLIIILLIIILGFVVLISPIAVIGFIFYSLFNLINDCHRRNKNYQFDIKNIQNV